MAKIIQFIKLNFMDTGIVNTGIRLKQGDNGIELRFSAFYGGQNMYSEENVPEIIFKRSDGVAIFAKCMASGVDSTYSYILNGNELDKAGDLWVDLKFKFEESDRESTSTALIEVVPDTITKDVRPSDVYINSVTLNDIEQLKTETANNAQRAETAAETAATNAAREIERLTEPIIQQATDAADRASGYAYDASISMQLLLLRGEIIVDNAREEADRAQHYADEAFSGTPEGYQALVQKVNGIAIDNATGESLSLTTAEGGAIVNSIEGKTYKSKNLWDEQWEVGSINDNGVNTNASDNIRGINYIPCKPNTSYYGVTKGVRIFWYDSNKTFIKFDTLINNSATSPSNASYFKIRTIASYGAVYNHDMAIFEGSTALPYEPYGLFSSGSMGYVDLGELDWDMTTTNVDSKKRLRSRSLVGKIKDITYNDTMNAYCDKYSIIKSSTSGTYGCNVGISSDSGIVYIYDENYNTPTSATDFKNAMKGVILAYELADGATADKYAMVVEEKGKNLLNPIKTNCETTTTVNGVTWTNLGDGRFMASGTASGGNSDIYVMAKSWSDLGENPINGNCVYKYYSTDSTSTNVRSYIYVYPEDRSTNKSVNAYGNQSVDASALSNESYPKILVLYQVPNGKTVNNVIVSGQIERGTESTEFIPYSHKDVIIPLDEPLYQNNVISMDGVVKNYVKKTVSVKRGGYTGPNNYLAQLANDTVKLNNNTIVDFVFCDKNVKYLSANKQYGTLETDISIAVNNAGLVYLTVKDITTAEQMDTWLANNPITIVYEIATPTTTPLTAEQKKALLSLETYKDHTYIDTTDTYAKATLDVKYSASDVGGLTIAANNKAELNEVLIKELTTAFLTATALSE